MTTQIPKPQLAQENVTLVYSPPAPSIDNRIQDIINRINYKDWIISFISKNDSRYIKVYIPHPDGPYHPTSENEQGYWSGRKWHVSPFMTDSEIILTCFKAITTAEEHETREAFLFDNIPVLGPHWNLIMLARLIKEHALTESVR